MKKTEAKSLNKEMEKVIRHHVWASITVGFVPIPAVDIVALTAIQLNLVRKIAGAFNVPFLRNKVKYISGSLIGSVLPGATGPILATSLTKSIPIIGSSAGAITMPTIAGASTYALGKVFIQHFGTGGTFLTFDPEKAKAYYAEMFKEGKDVANEAKESASNTRAHVRTERKEAEKVNVAPSVEKINKKKGRSASKKEKKGNTERSE